MGEGTRDDMKNEGKTCEACGMMLAIDEHHPDGYGWYEIKRDEDSEPWPVYGPIDPENVCYLCPLCHRLIHRGLHLLEIGTQVREFWKGELSLPTTNQEDDLE